MLLVWLYDIPSPGAGPLAPSSGARPWKALHVLSHLKRERLRAGCPTGAGSAATAGPARVAHHQHREGPVGMLVEHFRAMARNNAWYNHRLLSACGRLSPEAYAAPRTGFFPSIHRTLNHILI